MSGAVGFNTKDFIFDPESLFRPIYSGCSKAGGVDTENASKRFKGQRTGSGESPQRYEKEIIFRD